MAFKALLAFPGAPQGTPVILGGDFDIVGRSLPDSLKGVHPYVTTLCARAPPPPADPRDWLISNTALAEVIGNAPQSDPVFLHIGERSGVNVGRRQERPLALDAPDGRADGRERAGRAGGGGGGGG